MLTANFWHHGSFADSTSKLLPISLLPWQHRSRPGRCGQVICIAARLSPAGVEYSILQVLGVFPLYLGPNCPSGRGNASSIPSGFKLCRRAHAEALQASDLMHRANRRTVHRSLSLSLSKQVRAPVQGIPNRNVRSTSTLAAYWPFDSLLPLLAPGLRNKIRIYPREGEAGGGSLRDFMNRT